MLLPAPVFSDLLKQLRLLFDFGTLDVVLRTTVGRGVAELAGNKGFAEQASEVLTALCQSPSQLREVLKGIRAARPNEPAFATLLDRVQSALDEAAPTDDQLMEQVLVGGQHFADREAFRRLALELAEDNGPRVILLGGEPGVGKTHCWYFVEKLRVSKGIVPILVDLDEWGIGTEVRAAELVEALLSQVGAATDGVLEDPTAGQPRVARQLVDLLVKRLAARTTNPPIWAFVDHAYRANLRQDARDFLKLLAARVLKNGVTPGFRLVLVDPKGALAVQSSRPVLEVEPLHAGNLVELFLVRLGDKMVDPLLVQTEARAVLDDSATTDLQTAIESRYKKLLKGAG